MFIKNALFIVLPTLLALCGCETPKTEITQVATIDSLLCGVYDGSLSVGEIKQYGNLGIGTLNGLDGEMIMLDGVVHQLRVDGKSYLPADSDTVPFASVVHFTPEIRQSVGATANFSDFEKLTSEILPNRNLPVAIHLRGKFKTLNARSVPVQQKPYRPLAEVTKTQVEFAFSEVDGDIVGFRLPGYVKGINVPGWHLHFISADRSAGGHVLDFELENGTLEACEVHNLRILLPEDSAAFAAADLGSDRSAELKQAESSRK